MNSNPDISIILPVYCAERTLARCLDSILTQSFYNFELICINDASPDNSQGVIDSYQGKDKRIRSSHNQTNIGHGASRNRGVKLARGRYIFHVDPDDTIPPNALDTLLRTALKYESDMVKGGFLRFTNFPGTGVPNKQPGGTRPLVNTNIYETNELLHTTEGHWSYLYRREFHKKVLYPEDLQMGQDSIFMVSALLKAKKVTILGDIVYHYIYNEDSAMNHFSLRKTMDTLEWRKRSWQLLNEAGLTHLGDHLLQSYWNENLFKKMPSQMSQHQVLEFFDKLRITFTDLGIQATNKHTIPIVKEIFELIIDKKDNEAYEMLQRAGEDRTSNYKHVKTRVEGPNGVSIQILRNIQPVVHWNCGETTNLDSVNECETRKLSGPASNADPFKEGGTNPIKVLTVCSSDSGGAGTGSLRRVSALREYGVEAKLLSLQVRSDKKFVGRLSPALGFKDDDQDSVWRVVRENAMLKAMNSPDFCGQDTFSLTDAVVDFRQLGAFFQNYDVLHLHFTVGLLDYEHIGEVLAGKPIVWTLADMNPFTGGCHYSSGCQEFTNECRKCPQLGGRSNLAHEAWKIKRKAYEKLNLHFIAPSRWMAEQAKKSSLVRDRPVHVISNPFPVDYLRPVGRNETRNMLGLPLDKKLILFGADSLNNQRKGGDLLRQALDFFCQRYKADDVEVVTFGNGELKLEMPVHNLGPISGEEALSRAYSAADVFVLPSREDNAPLTVGEALLCGTPVVGFPVGYLPEIIRHKSTGYLAAHLDPEDLAKGIAWALNKGQKQFISSQCRQSALGFHTPEIAAMQHHLLFDEIVADYEAHNTFYIVTPCLNAVEDIDLTIESVISQAGDFTVRYHVQDRGSTDGTIEKLKKWEALQVAENQYARCRKVVFTWSTEPDQKIPDAITKAFDSLHVPSDAFMTWLSSGGTLLPGCLSRVRHVVLNDPDAQWVGGSQFHLGSSADIVKMNNMHHACLRFTSENQDPNIFFKMRLWYKSRQVASGSEHKLDTYMWRN